MLAKTRSKSGAGSGRVSQAQCVVLAVQRWQGPRDHPPCRKDAGGREQAPQIRDLSIVLREEGRGASAPEGRRPRPSELFRRADPEAKFIVGSAMPRDQA